MKPFQARRTIGAPDRRERRDPTRAFPLQPWPQTLAGGSLALDFVNTLDWRARPQPVETLREYRDLLRFALATGTLVAAEARALLAWSDRHPQLAARALERAREVRESIAALLAALAHRRPVRAEDAARFESWCRQALAGRRLSPAAKGLRWDWPGALDHDRPAAAAALDAERLLTAPDRPPIRECEGEGCGWFFLDTSRNHRRRWCSMESCGNRAKARRFYRRQRARG